MAGDSARLKSSQVMSVLLVRGPRSEQQGLREIDGSELMPPSILDGAKQKLEEGCGGNRKEL